MGNDKFKSVLTKYDEAVRDIRREDGCDMGVARLKLLDMARKNDPKLYPGLPDGFDLAAVKADMDAIEAE